MQEPEGSLLSNQKQKTMEENNTTPDVSNYEDITTPTNKVEPVIVNTDEGIDKSDLSPMDFGDYDEYMKEKEASIRTAKEHQSEAKMESVAHKDILQHLLSEVQP